MGKYIFLLTLIPVISLSQSGISISGLSQFYTGQSIVPINAETFSPITYETRNNKITLSIFRGRKFIIGTIAINAKLSYSINKTQYDLENTLNIPNYETIKKSLIPSLELWYIMFQTKTTFIYVSIGGYGIIEDLNIFTSEDNNDLYEYNGIIPFVRTGLQLNYRRFFINPFISFDLQQINFNKFSDILDSDIEEIIKNYTVRTGLEFGIMF